MLSSYTAILNHAHEHDASASLFDTALNISLEALRDTVILLPFLFIMFCIIEYFEHKATDKALKLLGRSSKLGPLVGACFGVLPQCGFSVLASGFYSNRLITIGTLLAVYISTSDEAFIILLSHPELVPEAIILILIKLVYAILIGYTADAVFKKQSKPLAHNRADIIEYSSHCHEGCGCKKHPQCSIFLRAVINTLKILLFIFIVNLVLSTAMTLIGAHALEEILLKNNAFLQPVVTALIGLIPNCAASIILANLFASGLLSTGALLSGLCAASGLGIAVLFKSNKKLKNNLLILLIVYISAIILGIASNMMLKII